MIHAAICDDSIPFTEAVCQLLKENAARRGLHVDPEVYYDGSYLTRKVREGERYDIIYLDIEMKEENGIDTARHIREVDRNVQIIYISGYETYALQGYEVEAHRFLPKPLDLEKFRESFDSALDILMIPEGYYCFRAGRTEYKLPLKKIMYMESRRRKLYFFMENGDTFSCNMTLDRAEAEIKTKSKYFLRVQKSYLVNYHYVKTMKRTEITLYNGMVFPISHSRERQIRERYLEICQ